MSAAFNSLVCEPTPEGGLICRPTPFPSKKPKKSSKKPKKTNSKAKSKPGPKKQQKSSVSKKRKPKQIVGPLHGQSESKAAERATVKGHNKKRSNTKKAKKPQNGYNF